MSDSSPVSSVFHVTILGDNDCPLRGGSLEATSTSLVYTEDSSPPTRYSWPLRQLRRAEVRGSREDVLVIEGLGGSRPCPPGGIGGCNFQTPHAKKIQELVSRNLQTSAKISLPVPFQILDRNETGGSQIQNETSPVHWRLNTSSVSTSDSSLNSTNHSPVHSHSSSLVTGGTTGASGAGPGGGVSVYDVERVLNGLSATEEGTLEVGGGVVVYSDLDQRQSLQWPIEYLRKHGHENDMLVIETGRRCLGGAGLYNFRTPRAAEINATLRAMGTTGGGGASGGGGRSSTGSSIGGGSGSGESPSPTEVQPQHSASRVFATPPPPTPPSSSSHHHHRMTPPPPSVSSTPGFPPHSRRTGPLPPLPPTATPPPAGLTTHPTVPPGQARPRVKMATPPPQPPAKPPRQKSLTPNHTPSHSHAPMSSSSASVSPLHNSRYTSSTPPTTPPPIPPSSTRPVFAMPTTTTTSILPSSLGSKYKQTTPSVPHNSSSSSSSGRGGSGRLPDSNMRRAFSAMDVRGEVYDVRNLSDDKQEVGRGSLEVTATDIIYIDARTREKWKWPFKYLRKYGFESNIFSFEAGRKCTGGQGLYAFATERAKDIYQSIVDNIRGANSGSNASRRALDPSTSKVVDRSGPRLSLADEKLAVPTSPGLIRASKAPLANVNQYTFDVSPGGTRKFSSPRIQAPPTTTATPTPGVGRPRSNRAASTPQVLVPSSVSDYSLSSAARSTDHAPPAESSREEEALSSSGERHTPSPSPPTPPAPQPTPECQLVKPVMEPPQRSPHREQHLYEVPRNYGQDSVTANSKGGSVPASINGSHETSTETGRGSPGGSNAVRKVSVSPDVTSRPPSSNSTGGKGEERKEKSKGGGGSGKKKDKGNFLSWLKGRNSPNSNRGDPSESGISTKSKSKKKKGKKGARDGGVGGGSGGGQSVAGGEYPKSMLFYENVGEARLRKMPFSASCDNLLESGTHRNYPDLTTSSSSTSSPPPPYLGTSGESNVPQPGLGRLAGPPPSSPAIDIAPHHHAPPHAQKRPRSAEFPDLAGDSSQEQEPEVPATSVTSLAQAMTLYQNLDDVRRMSAAGTDSEGVAVRNLAPALYTNIELPAGPNEAPSLVSAPVAPKPMSYADLNLGSLDMPPSPAGSAGNGGLSIMSSSGRGIPRSIIKKPSLTAIILESQRNKLSEGNRLRLQTDPETAAVASDTPPGSLSSSVSSSSGAAGPSGDQPAVGNYVVVDFKATNALAHIKREHGDARIFEEVLGRHDLREMELKGGKGRRGRILASRDHSPPVSP